MSKVKKLLSGGVLVFILLSCSAFPSGRMEEASAKWEARAFWVLDSKMSTESAAMFLESFLLPTSLATMLWTEFSVQQQEVQLDTRAAYRVVRKARSRTDPLGAHTVYGYDLVVSVTVKPPSPRRNPDSYTVRFSCCPSSAEAAGVVPQPLEQALLAGIRKDGRSSGRARVERIDYLGSGEFEATVLVGD
jgi:hypothetical protein